MKRKIWATFLVIFVFSMITFIDVGGYAECVTLLNDTNYRSRLLEQIRFDIVSVEAGRVSYYNDNYENGNRKPFLTTYSKSLFSEAAPVTEMDNKPMETSADNRIFL